MVFLGREITEQRYYSEKVAQGIDEEVETIILEAYSNCKRLLVDNNDKLIQIAQYLLVNEVAEGAALIKLFDSEVPPLEGAVPAGA